MIYESRGIDNNKIVNGRKLQLLVDTGGRLWRAVVPTGNKHELVGGSILSYNVEAMDSR